MGNLFEHFLWSIFQSVETHSIALYFEDICTFDIYLYYNIWILSIHVNSDDYKPNHLSNGLFVHIWDGHTGHVTPSSHSKSAI